MQVPVIMKKKKIKIVKARLNKTKSFSNKEYITMPILIVSYFSLVIYVGMTSNIENIMLNLSALLIYVTGLMMFPLFIIYILYMLCEKIYQLELYVED
jgi:hypothetical protein